MYDYLEAIYWKFKNPPYEIDKQWDVWINTQIFKGYPIYNIGRGYAKLRDMEIFVGDFTKAYYGCNPRMPYSFVSTRTKIKIKHLSDRAITLHIGE